MYCITSKTIFFLEQIDKQTNNYFKFHPYLGKQWSWICKILHGLKTRTQILVLKRPPHPKKSPKDTSCNYCWPIRQKRIYPNLKRQYYDICNLPYFSRGTNPCSWDPEQGIKILIKIWLHEVPRNPEKSLKMEHF